MKGVFVEIIKHFNLHNFDISSWNENWNEKYWQVFGKVVRDNVIGHLGFCSDRALQRCERFVRPSAGVHPSEHPPQLRSSSNIAPSPSLTLLSLRVMLVATVLYTFCPTLFVQIIDTCRPQFVTPPLSLLPQFA